MGNMILVTKNYVKGIGKKIARKNKGGGFVEYLLIIVIVIAAFAVISLAFTNFWSNVSSWLSEKGSSIFV